MKALKKRLAAFVVITSIISSLVGTTPVFAGGMIEIPTDSYIVKEEFDKRPKDDKVTKNIEVSHFRDDSGNGMMKLVDPGSGSVNGDGGHYYYPDVKMSPDESVIVISLDFMVEALDYHGQIVLSSSDGGTERVIFPMTAAGQISAEQTYMQAPKVGSPVTNYEPNKWHTLTLEVNREEKQQIVYLDGVGFGTMFYNGDWGNTATVRIDRFSAKKGVGNTMYIDNIVFGYDGSVPLYKDDCNITLECDALGYAFFEKEVEFAVSYENTTDKARSYEICAELVSDIKTTDFSQTDTVELAPGETKKLTYKASVSRYGIYEICIKATDMESKEVFTEKSELVTLRKVEVKNPQIGICDHTALFGDGINRIDEKFQFIRNTGISAIREMAQWVDWEKTVGVYKMSDKFKLVFDTAKANDLEVYLLAGMHNYLVAPGERPPESEKGIKGFGRYAYNMVKDTMPYGDAYEVYNEWNIIPAFNATNLPPEAYVPLIREAYQRIKEANPNAKVHGLSGLSLARDTYLSYAERMFEAGVADYCDGFTIHPYDHSDGPDHGKHMWAITSMRELMEKYGAGDKELIITEAGWQTAMYPADTIASYVVKYATMSYDLVDQIYWYVSQQKINTSEGERSFGWMMDANEQAEYVAYAPQEQYIAISNYNYHMAEAEKLGEIEVADSDSVLHHFKRRDGKDVIVAWVKDRSANEELELSIEADSAIVEDMYGNGEEIKTKDGKLYLSLDTKPHYIVGDFGDVSVQKSDFAVSKTELSAVANDNTEFYITKDESLDNVSVELQLPDNVTVEENNGFADGRARVLLKLGSQPKDDAMIGVKLVDNTTGKICYTTQIGLKYVDAVVVDAIPKILDDDRWQIGLSVKNMKLTTPISGEITFKEPRFAVKNVGKVRFENIQAGNEFITNINPPDSWNEYRNNIACDIVLDSGEKFDVNCKVNLNGIVYIKASPKIDGVLEKGEWDERMPFVLDRASQVKQISDWGGTEDLSAKLFFNWDKDNLYVAARVRDDELCDNPDNAIWQNDSVQFAIAPQKVKSGNRSEFGIGLLDGKAAFERSAQMKHNTVTADSTGDFSDFEDVEYAVTRSGDMTYYEMRIPWEVVAYEEFEIGDYENLYVSMIVNDNDGSDSSGRGWIEFCTGVATQKDAINFEGVRVFR